MKTYRIAEVLEKVKTAGDNVRFWAWVARRYGQCVVKQAKARLKSD